MNKKQDDREGDIYLQALEMMPGNKRSAWLKEACRGDLDLRRDIEELLGESTVPRPLFRDTAVWSPLPDRGESARQTLLSKV